ncbi:aspartate kinase [Caloramator proteoclasticus]|uniref:Aspartokinase n=1 Tax=Caloramator proteoclasticus DSM 10124 TaxID=1121262 RepID=A0A1M4SNI3_9CLOT|nr:aspartate kinase [Caloramator proteoclasticus]SHE33729.1 aspartate kinase [Caloramator proteoclasticus DSM 10124]
MKIIVQKFGGTSVSTHQRREMVADKVLDAIKRGYKPVVVVSAIGRKGDPYATDTLLSLLDNEKTYLEKREYDILMSCGEIISCVVLSEVLSKRGLKVRVLTGGQAGIVTNDNFGNAEILRIDTNRIINTINDGYIPVVAGFQGMTQSGEITTLGRGGSDITGTALGAALKADFVEIYTDVDGIMTADPRIVSNAHLIETMSYNEVFQFADQGAKVIHPRAVEYAMKSNIPVYIKNTMSNSRGTLITISRENIGRIITGITHMSSRTQISIEYDESCQNADDIFEVLANNKISIDLINVFPDYRVFTVNSKQEESVIKILEMLKIKYKVVSNCSKIAVIGNGMRGTPGIMAKILKALKERNIKVLQTADSHTTIWCLVKEEDTESAIKALHEAFDL